MRTRRWSLLACLLLPALFTPPARATDSIGEPLARALAPLEHAVTTGVLYDRALPLAHLERWDGTPSAPVVDARLFAQAVDELRRATLAAGDLPEPAALRNAVSGRARAGVVPLGLLDRAYERVRPGAIDDGSLRATGDRVEIAREGAALLVRGRAFAAAPLLARTARGSHVTFVLDPALVFADRAPREITIDFGDGRGPQAVTPGAPSVVRYAETGTHTLTTRIVRDDGSTAESRSAIEVAALAAPLPDDTLHVTASIPWQSSFGSGDAYVYLAPGRTAIANPVVVVEGFDFNNEQNWDELYDQLNQENLIEQIRADGFDIVVLNFTDATEAIQKNAFVVTELLQQIQASLPSQASIALVGASMGGLCSRYALTYLEYHGIPHRVRTWLSFDAPHLGADIPLGLQFWIDFFAGQSADAATFRAILQRPAARQMLLYHYQTPPTYPTQSDAARGAMLADFAAIGDWPSLVRRVAITNGSGNRVNQGFLPGDQLIRWQYSSFLVAVTGNVWAVPDMTSHIIFQGSTRIAFSTTSRNISVTYTRPWDGAPGGSRATLDELAAVQAPYGDIVALHSSHDFIPSVSALALPTNDPFFDIAGTPGLTAMTPFDAVYFPTTNEPHVLVTPENAVWVKQEIEAGVVSVPSSSPAIAGLRLTATPNPVAGPVALSFALPAPARARLAIFGIDGREVRRLVDAPLEAGSRIVRWDGTDATGAHVPAGVYFARLTSGANSTTLRIARLR